MSKTESKLEVVLDSPLFKYTAIRIRRDPVSATRYRSETRHSSNVLLVVESIDPAESLALCQLYQTFYCEHAGMYIDKQMQLQPLGKVSGETTLINPLKRFQFAQNVEAMVIQ